MKYRADVDGMRAIAILGVLIYHFFPSVLPGGFIGVDVFFVISGYLISSNIYELIDSKESKFRFFDFYSRRVIRLFPALILVLFVCLVVGYVLLYPLEYKALGKHISMGAIFIANIGFLQESGYFDTSANLKPLLHLWSLGIEEQFYIIWPILIVLLWRLSDKRSYLFLGALAISSFIASLCLIDKDQAASFFCHSIGFGNFV